MLLNLEQSTVPMKCVFLLSEDLKKNPRKIELTQALTLNPQKPNMGLKGTYGLFGSQEWWNSIDQKRVPLKFVSGMIQNLYVAGQDQSEQCNSFELLLDDGTTLEESVYINNESDRRLFCVGARVDIVYVFDELKQQPAIDGGVNYLDIVLEMAVSLKPIG